MTAPKRAAASRSPSPSGSRFNSEHVPLMETSRGKDSPDLEPTQSGGSDSSGQSDGGLSLYEKKALLVNRELDSHGMGRYQWWIFFLCGFGYFIDLLWAQAFALVLSPLQNELGFPADQNANLSASFNAGLAAGAFIWGVLADIIGRRWSFNLTCLFSSVFGLCLGIPSDYNSILVLTAFVGFGVGGNIPIDTTICLEFLPQDRRFLLALLSIFQPLGIVACSAISFGFIPNYSCEATKPCNSVAAGEPCCTKASNMGWRYTLFTLGGMTLAIFFLRFLVFNFQESAKFLLYKGHDDKAIEVLQYIAKFNKSECSLGVTDFEALNSEEQQRDARKSSILSLGAGSVQTAAPLGDKVKLELARYKLLFSSVDMARRTILVWIAYIFDYWAFSVAGFFLPTILLNKNKDLNIPLTETYRNYIIIYTPGIVGVALGALMYGVPRIGRKWGMVGSSALMGISLFCFAAVNSEASNIGLNLMEYFFQSMYNAILYGWTPEVFPAPVRGTACGVASFWGRLFSIVAPIIAGHIYVVSQNGVLYLAGAAALISTLAILLMPSKSIGEQSL